MRVLIVEDISQTKSALCRELTAAGLAADRARDAHCAVSLARMCDYDLMIVECRLRGSDASSLIRNMRAIGNFTPVLLLGCPDLSLDQMLAFGADDALPLSCSTSIVLEHVRALLRTFSSGRRSTPTRLYVADLELDTAIRRSFRARRPLALTDAEYSTLKLLMTRRGEIITRELIASSALTSDTRDFTAVDAHMSRLRRKVDGKAIRRLVHMVRGIGFVLEDRGVCR